MCSYCGCRNIALIGPLSQQHEDIANCTYLLRTAMLAGAEHETIDSAVDAIVAGDLTRIQPLLTLLDNHSTARRTGCSQRRWPSWTTNSEIACKHPRWSAVPSGGRSDAVWLRPGQGTFGPVGPIQGSLSSITVATVPAKVKRRFTR